MTNVELKKIISQSPQADEYNSQEFTFNFPYLSYSKTFIGLSSVYTFVNQQLKGWQSYNDEDLPAELNNSITYFNVIKQRIIEYVNSYAHQDLNNIQSYISPVIQVIQNVRTKPLLYNLPEVDFLIKIHKDLPNSYPTAHSVIVGEFNYPLLSSKESLIGMIASYEFILKDNSSIVERRNAEKKSINSLRSDFVSYISETEKETTKQLKESEKKYFEQIESIEEIKTDKETIIEEWFNESKSNFDTFYTSSNENIGALESAYNELLSLKKPADYWKERATELKKEGDNFFKVLLGIVGFAVITLYLLLWLTPEGMEKTFFNDDKSLAIRWSIIYITLISFLFFAIKAVMKSMFSSYHLSRDAEERQRLTYVYLAMVKDASIDREDRHLVMQSLFSRADTGLLKDDSSPSMPGTGGILDVIKSK